VSTAVALRAGRKVVVANAILVSQRCKFAHVICGKATDGTRDPGGPLRSGGRRAMGRIVLGDVLAEHVSN